MVLRFYNTLTKKKEAFKPLKKGEVRMYNCGPTVYMYAHIGNFRAYVFADLLRRYLEWRGLKVKQVMNITDVGHMTFDVVADSTGEDKVEKAAREEHKTPEQIARFYEEAFYEDAGKLNIKKAGVYPRATEHIPEMIEMIGKLLKKGYAYRGEDGWVYYDVTKFKGYGKLSGNTLEKLKAGHRLEVKKEKRHPQDFALWIKNPKHMMQWDSPWGRGYPGWHVECSAMSTKYLGLTLDIHTGGEDNIFPHHECEIAQSEGATGKPFVKYWMHTRHLIVDGKKMSKSLGNFYTLRDLLKKGHSPKAIRFLLLSAHYRTKLNLTEAALRQAEKNVKGLEELAARLKEIKDGKPNKELDKLTKKAGEEFGKAMDDDLNISLGLAKVFGFVREVNKALDSGK
ncbi:MAG: cysteine--tRNA ligase, partial [Candidatus Aenigmatarchaeota archaeon]